MARSKRPTGDDAYNARRRYFRAAQRHLKAAEKLSGASAARERALGRMEYEKALDTYDPETTQRVSAPMRNLGAEFGIDVDQRRRDLQVMGKKQRESEVKQARQKREELIDEEESGKSKASYLKDPDKRSEREAQMLFGNQNVSHRILGGLVDIWNVPENRKANGKIDTSKILPTLFEHFGVDTLSNLLEKVETQIGEMLYGSDQDEIYDVVSLKLKTLQVA